MSSAANGLNNIVPFGKPASSGPRPRPRLHPHPRPRSDIRRPKHFTIRSLDAHPVASPSASLNLYLSSCYQGRRCLNVYRSYSRAARERNDVVRLTGRCVIVEQVCLTDVLFRCRTTAMDVRIVGDDDASTSEIYRSIGECCEEVRAALERRL